MSDGSLTETELDEIDAACRAELDDAIVFAEESLLP